MQKARSIEIPFDDGNFEFFPDEIPEDFNDLAGVLRAVFAPLSTWRSSAVEYYRQGKTAEFDLILKEIVGAIAIENFEKHYRESPDFDTEMVHIYDALAADTLAKLGREADKPANSEAQIATLSKRIVQLVEMADKIDNSNRYTHIIKGFFDFRQGDFERAEIIFKSNLQSSVKKQSAMPKDKRKNEVVYDDASLLRNKYSYASLLGLGLVSLSTHKYAPALDYFCKAVRCRLVPEEDLDANDILVGSGVRVAIALCCFYLDQLPRCKAALDKALELNPSNANALVMVAYLERKENIAKAQKAASKSSVLTSSWTKTGFEYCFLAVQIDPTNAAALNYMAHYYYQTWVSVDREAVVVYRAEGGLCEVWLSSEISGSASVSSICAEDMLLLGGKHQCFIKEVRTEPNPTNENLEHRVLVVSTPLDATVIAKLGATKGCIVDKNDQGQRILHVQTSVKLVSQIKNLTQRSISSTSNHYCQSDSYYILGKVLRLQGDIAHSIEYFQHSSDLAESKNALSLFQLGELYLSRKDFSSSLSCFERALLVAPGDCHTLSYIILIKAIYKKENSPVADIRKAVSSVHSFPFEYDVWLAQGQLRLRDHKDYENALVCLEEAQAVKKKTHQAEISPQLLMNISVLHQQLGDYTKALKYSDHVLDNLFAREQIELLASSGTTLTTSVLPSFRHPTNELYNMWAPLHMFNEQLEKAHVQVAYSSDDSVLTFELTAEGEGTSTVPITAASHVISSIQVGDELLVDPSSSHLGRTRTLSEPVGECVVCTVTSLVLPQVSEAEDMYMDIETADNESDKKSDVQPVGVVVTVNNNGLLPCSQSCGLHVKSSKTLFSTTGSVGDMLTASYNRAKLLEDMGHAAAAKELYIELLKQHRSMADCYVQLCGIARAAGDVEEAFFWILQGLSYFYGAHDHLSSPSAAAASYEHLYALQMALSELYYRCGQWGLSKKAIEKILSVPSNNSNTNDVGAHTILGSLYHKETIFVPKVPKTSNTPSNHEEYLRNSYKFHYNVLLGQNPAVVTKKENCFAANGLGVICAEKEKYEAARQIFTALAADLCTATLVAHKVLYVDVMANLGHVYMLQKNFVDAVQSYGLSMRAANALKEKQSNAFAAAGVESASTNAPQGQFTEILTSLAQCLAAAYRKRGLFKEGIRTLQDATLVDQTDMQVWFNLACLREEYAHHLYQMKKKTIEDLDIAMAEYQAARIIFDQLKNDDSSRKGNKAGFGRRPRHNKAMHYDVSHAQEHQQSCINAIGKTKIIQQKLREQDIVKLEEQTKHEALAKHHLLEKNRLKEEERQRLEAECLVKQEKAKSKADRLAALQNVWRVQDVAASEPEKKRGKKTKHPDMPAIYDSDDNDAEPAPWMQDAKPTKPQKNAPEMQAHSSSEEEVSDSSSEGETNELFESSDEEGEGGDDEAAAKSAKRKRKEEKKAKKLKKKLRKEEHRSKKHKSSDKDNNPSSGSSVKAAASASGGLLKSKQSVVEEDDEDLFGDNQEPGSTSASTSTGPSRTILGEDSDDEAALPTPATKQSTAIEQSDEEEMF